MRNILTKEISEYISDSIKKDGDITISAFVRNIEPDAIELFSNVTIDMMAKIILEHGLGQMGELLKKAIKDRKIKTRKNIVVYHTWNVWGRTEKQQQTSYNKFLRDYFK